MDRRMLDEKQWLRTAGMLFHSTNLPLTKWFCAIYLTASDKGGISAVRLGKTDSRVVDHCQPDPSLLYNNNYRKDSYLPKLAK